jgi:hypothetical protein
MRYVLQPEGLHLLFSPYKEMTKTYANYANVMFYNGMRKRQGCSILNNGVD